MKFERNKVIHRTTGVKQGDWIIYRCPLCDYELHDNTVTGELIIKNAKADIGHKGTYKPFTKEKGTQATYCRPAWILN
jgi:hypothetical protein